jgi:hypothetical protein
MRLSTKEMPKQVPKAPVNTPSNQPQPPSTVVSRQNDGNVAPGKPKQPVHSDHISSRARGVSAIRAQSGITSPPAGLGRDALNIDKSSAPALEVVQLLDYQLDGASKGRQKAGILMWGAVVMTCLLVLVGVVITLTRYGIWDVTPYVPLKEIGIEPPQLVVEKEPGEKLELEKPDPEMVFSKAFREGTNALQAKNFSKAVLEYNRALSVHPHSPKALGGLAKAFEGLGDREQALHNLNMAKSNEAKRDGAQETVP